MPTINEAIIEVIKDEGRPLTPKEIFSLIVARNYYSFNAIDPVHVVKSQLRRHCHELNFPSSSKRKLFHLVEGNKFALTAPAGTPKRSAGGSGPGSAIEALKRACSAEIDNAREHVLSTLRSIDPSKFEIFAKNLLDAYGFENTQVTQRTSDGGIDGFGRLKVGLSHLNVAFQCKRWKGTVQRPEIDRFRGAIQGKYEQGIIFTTSTFSKGALSNSRRPGAAPVILFDGNKIFDIMIEKKIRTRLRIHTHPYPSAGYDARIDGFR